MNAPLVPEFPDLDLGPDLRARRHRPDDVPAIVEQCLDPASIAFTTIPHPYTEDDARWFAGSRAERWAAGEEFSTALELDGAFAGTVDLRPQPSGRIGLGFALHPAARGRGVLRRALPALMDWGVEALGARVYLWEAIEGNWASRRTAWSLGFDIAADALPALLLGRDEDPTAPLVRVGGWYGAWRVGEPRTPRHPWHRPPVLHGATAAGEPFTLRPQRADDAPRVVEGCSDPATSFWLTHLPAPYTLADARTHHEGSRRLQALGRAAQFTIADADDRALGDVRLFTRDGSTLGGGPRSSDVAEIGYWVHPAARRRGLMSAAARLAADWALRPLDEGGLGLRRLVLAAGDGNAGSIRTAGAAGFALWGREPGACVRRDGSRVDLLHFARG